VQSSEWFIGRPGTSLLGSKTPSIRSLIHKYWTSQKKLLGTRALVLFATLSVTKKKSFMTLALDHVSAAVGHDRKSSKMKGGCSAQSRQD
jgi:hypothetical protein